MRTSQLTADERQLRKRKRSCLNQLRKAFKMSDTYISCLEAAKKGNKYTCAICGLPTVKTKCEIDHITPIAAGYKPQHELTDQEMLERLFCCLDNLQVVCKECHAKKTLEDRRRKK